MPHARFFRSIWPALTIVAVLVAVNWALINKREFPPFDASALFGPHHHLIAAFALQGRWLSWDPWTNAGTPEYAEPEYGAYSPLVLLTGYLANGSEAGFRVYWLIVWCLGGLGMIALGRHLRAPRWGATACAIAFVCCGFYIGNAENTPMLYGFSCLPWLIWRADAAWQRRSWMGAAQAGAILGAAALGGYPGLVILDAGYVSLWLLGRALTSPGRRRATSPLPRDAIRAAAVLLLIAVISATVMAAAYVPFFVDAAGFASRTGALPRDVAVANDALVPAALLTAASPAINLLLPMDTDMSMRNVYLGALAPMLATLALVRCRHAREARWRVWLLGLAMLSVVCALATIFPLRGWLYDCCLPFRYFRHAALFRAYLLFSVTTLALYGCRDFAARAGRRRQSSAARASNAIVTAAVAALIGPSAIAVIVLTIVFTRHPAAGSLAHAHGFLVWMLAPVLAIGMVRRGNRALAAAVVAFAALDGIGATRLAGPLLHQSDPGWYQRSDLRYHGLDLTTRGLARDIEDLNNTNLWNKRPVVRSYSAFTSPWFTAISKHPVFERAASQPRRIFFAADAPTVPLDDATLARMLDRAAALDKPVLVVSSPQAPASASPAASASSAAAIDIDTNTLPPVDPIDVHLDRYTPDELTFSTTTPTAGWLLVTDRWARGWKATVNNAPVPVLVGDFVFRAVRVPAGRVRVRFTYEKSHGLWLVALSWTTCGALLIVAPLFSVIRSA